MKLIQPSAQYLRQQDDMFGHIAQCARLCYKSDRTTGNEALCERLWRNGHRSMFRHWTFYYIIDDIRRQPQHIRQAIDEYAASPYAAVVRKNGTVYMSCNGQFAREHITSMSQLNQWNVPLKAFVAHAVGDDDVLSLVRFTVVVTTSIGIMRELNRVSPNNIAEQSTRYVDFGRRGGVTVCEPSWYGGRNFFVRFLARQMWRTEAAFYGVCRNILGLKPEEARGYLPLDTASRAAYTYTVREWHHIINLRLRNTTGRAHPDAQRVAGLVKQLIDNRLRLYSATASV